MLYEITYINVLFLSKNIFFKLYLKIIYKI